MTWRDDGWPVIGTNADDRGRGEPVRTWTKPKVDRPYPVQTPQTSDEFERPHLGFQWQWQANPREGSISLTANEGSLRQFSQRVASRGNLWTAPNLLLQKWPAAEFVVTAALRFSPVEDREAAGVIVFGRDYAWLGVRQTIAGARLGLYMLKDADRGGVETEVASLAVDHMPLYLRVAVQSGARCRFSYSFDNSTYTRIGDEFAGRQGIWVGAKVGVFAIADPSATGTGSADWAWFRVGGQSP
jgi:beta-xylosidase